MKHVRHAKPKVYAHDINNILSHSSSISSHSWMINEDLCKMSSRNKSKYALSDLACAHV